MPSTGTSYELEAPLNSIPVAAPIENAQKLQEWPELVGLEGLLLDNDQIPLSNITSHESPAELHNIPANIPDDLLRIVEKSLNILPEDATEYKQPTPANPTPAVSTATPPASEEARSTPSPSNITLLQNKGSHDILPNSNSFNGSDGSKTPSKVSNESGYMKSAFSRLRAPKDKKNIKSRLGQRNSFQECVSCSGEILTKSLLILDCKHKYCLSCFTAIIATAVENETKFPPKCCSMEIPSKVICHNLGHKRREAYNGKMQQYLTSERNRWYCSSPTCGKLIQPKKIKPGASTQKCPSCRLIMCSSCRSSVHPPGETCPRSIRQERRQDSIEMLGWRKCFRCTIMVELSSDSGYIICDCGAEFCCICGVRGGICDCLGSAPVEDHAKEDMAMDGFAATIAKLEQMAQVRLRRKKEQKGEQEDKDQREETRRREEIEAHDKEVKRLMSIAQTVRELQSGLAQINRSQRTCVIARHQGQAELVNSTAESVQQEFGKRRQRLETALRANVQRRKAGLEAKYAEKTQRLRARHDEEEDETFVRMQRHLKDKPNREEREKSILDRLHAAQKKELAAVENGLKEETQEIDFHAGLQSTALQTSIAKKYNDIEKEKASVVYDLSSRVIADRRWFSAVFSKRYELLEQHRAKLVNESKLRDNNDKNDNRSALPPPVELSAIARACEGA